MRSTFAISLHLVAVVSALVNAHSSLHNIHRRDPVEAAPSELPKAQTFRSYGCYSGAPNTTDANVDSEYLSSGSCNKACAALGQAVSALSPDKCYCGMQYPPDSDKIDLEKCNYPCNGYDLEACGGLKDAFSIFNTGLVLAPDTYSGPSSASSSSTGSSSSTSATSKSGNPTQSQKSSGSAKSGGPKPAAIAAGVVVGVIAAAAIIGVIVFFVRRRRNAEIEEEHRRNAAVNAFISGSKSASSTGGPAITDSRLDPIMARRISDGSIADNQDFSRKILRVTNA